MAIPSSMTALITTQLDNDTGRHKKKLLITPNKNLLFRYCGNSKNVK